MILAGGALGPLKGIALATFAVWRPSPVVSIAVGPSPSDLADGRSGCSAEGDEFAVSGAAEDGAASVGAGSSPPCAFADWRPLRASSFVPSAGVASGSAIGASSPSPISGVLGTALPPGCPAGCGESSGVRGMRPLAGWPAAVLSRTAFGAAFGGTFPEAFCLGEAFMATFADWRPLPCVPLAADNDLGGNGGGTFKPAVLAFGGLAARRSNGTPVQRAQHSRQ